LIGWVWDRLVLSQSLPVFYGRGFYLISDQSKPQLIPNPDFIPPIQMLLPLRLSVSFVLRLPEGASLNSWRGSVNRIGYQSSGDGLPERTLQISS